ncbi:hypothetical protein RUND412_001212 [Rhizina undulata]
MADLTHNHHSFPTQKKDEYNAMSPEHRSTNTHPDLNPKYGSLNLGSTFQDPPGIYPVTPPRVGLPTLITPMHYLRPVVQVRSTAPANTDSSSTNAPTAAKTANKTKKRAETDIADGDHNFRSVASEWRAAKDQAMRNLTSRSNALNYNAESVEETEDSWQEEFRPKPKRKKTPVKRKNSVELEQNGAPGAIRAPPNPAGTKKKKIDAAVIIPDSDDDAGVLDSPSTPQADSGVLQASVSQGEGSSMDGESSHRPQTQRIMKPKVNLEAAKSTLVTSGEHGRTEVPDTAARKNLINFDDVNKEPGQAGFEILIANNPSGTRVRPYNLGKKTPSSRKRKSVGDGPENEDIHMRFVAREPSSSLSPPPPEFDELGELPKAKAPPKTTSATKANSGTGVRGRKKSKLEINAEKYEVENEDIPDKTKAPATGTEGNASRQQKKPQPRATRTTSAKVRVKASENLKSPVLAETARDQDEEKAEKAEVKFTPREEEQEDAKEKEKTPASIVNTDPSHKSSEQSAKKASESSGKKFSWQNTRHRVGLSRMANIQPLLKSVKK